MEIERKELDEQRDRLLKQQGRLRSKAEVRTIYLACTIYTKAHLNIL